MASGDTHGNALRPSPTRYALTDANLLLFHPSIGFGWRRGASLGTIVTMDNPQGGEAKALLSAPDGSGLRCDLRNGAGRGDGVCRDDQGRTYDVQIRPGPRH